jgi:hypothetical protein
MDFEAAMRFLKAFSGCHLRLVKEFSGFPGSNSRESAGEYVIFSDASLANESCYLELENFAQAHGLVITPFGEYLMFSSSNSKA